MKNKVIIGISAIIVILVMVLFLVSMKTDEPGVQFTEDEVNFKNEYENLNGTEYKTSILKTISIPGDNNVKYITEKDILNEINTGDKVIYLGWAECNWCRTMLPILLETLKENEIETLYYFNFKELRTAYELGEDEEKVEIYEELLKIVGEDINQEFDEESLRSGIKKIVAPTVIFIKDGKYIGLHEKTVDSQTKSSDVLKEEQEKELKGIYQELIDRLNFEVCVEEGC